MIKPVVAAIDMGYGHLRPAAALADHLATEVVQMDAPPVGSKRDRAHARSWNLPVGKVAFRDRVLDCP